MPSPWRRRRMCIAGMFAGDYRSLLCLAMTLGTSDVDDRTSRRAVWTSPCVLRSATLLDPRMGILVPPRTVT